MEKEVFRKNLTKDIFLFIFIKKILMQSLYFTFFFIHVYPSFANMIFHFPFIILINYNGNGDDVRELVWGEKAGKEKITLCILLIENKKKSCVKWLKTSIFYPMGNNG